ncbi:tubulin-tyrosine ligase/Tubulin polyglutamylase, partial [Tribonema minus]
PRSRELTRKDLLKKHLTRAMAASARHAREFHIMPQTFVLPHEYTAFVAATNIWIMKPVGLSRGRGIEVIDDVSAVRYSDSVVVQRYVGRPLLLGGYKFDLRLYVLVTSFNPLEAFLYREGFARVSTRAYDVTAEGLRDRFVHLTNSSIQATRDSPLLDGELHETGGTKASLTYLWARLRRARVPVDRLWSDITALVVKALVACEPGVPAQPNAFELFGFDVLVDAALRPWLLEVNASPQMDRDHALDRRVKEALIRVCSARRVVACSRRERPS